MEHVIRWVEDMTPKALSFTLSLVIAILIFLIGRRLIVLVLKLLKRNFKRMKIDEGAIKFLISASRVVLNVILIVLMAQVMGLETSSVIALVGSAGLAIGLSMQGSLANFAGGVMILSIKPFVLGDYIKAGEQEGTVVGIDVIYTKLLTIDNKYIVLPNGKLADCNIINYTHENKRRIDLLVGVDYGENVKRVRDVLEKKFQNYEGILPEEPIQIYVNGFDSSSISIGIRVWVKTEEYWSMRFRILEDIKTIFDENGIEIPYDQLEVKVKS